MSTSTAPTNGPRTGHFVKTGSSHGGAPDPFHMPFDDDDEEEKEWWDEESPILARENPPSISRMTQWPTVAEHTVDPVPKRAQRSMRVPMKRYSVQKPTREKSRQRQKMKNAAAGIKLITNVSRHQGPVPIAQKPNAPSQAPSNVPQAGCFIDLAALQALNDPASNAAGGFWKSIREGMKSGRSGPANVVDAEGTMYADETLAAKEAVTAQERIGNRRGHGLIPPPLKLEADLSPSDRPIVIGISIPSASLAQHTKSPQTATSTISTIIQSANTTFPNDGVPETPTIVITPSQAPSNWFSNEKSAPSQRRPRARSSVYSRATNFFSSGQNFADAPPMPISTLRKSGSRGQTIRKSVRHSTSTVFSEDSDTVFPRRSRALSSYTVFEEDESPIVTKRARAVSISEGNARIKHTSITAPDQRRSKGWWNYITTPFLTRSNTLISVPNMTNGHPALPTLTTTSPGVARDPRNWEKSYFSPMTPATSTTIASDAWWDKQGNLGASEAINSPEEECGTLPFMLAAGSATILNMSGQSSGEPQKAQRDNLARMASRSSQTSPLSASNREIPLILAGSDHKLQPVAAQNNSVQPSSGDVYRSILAQREPAAPIISQGAAIIDAGLTPRPQGDLPYSPQPPPYSPPRAVVPRYRAVFPPGHPNLHEPPSPGPVTPSLQQTMSSRGGIALSDVPLTPAPRRLINLNSGYPGLPARQPVLPITEADLRQPSEKAKKAEAKRRRYEKEDALAHRVGGLWRGRGCIPKRGCYGRSGAEGRKRRRCWFGLVAGFLSMIILIVILATTLHHNQPSTIQHSQWLNLTGFPPIFTGISTIAAPDNIVANSGCMQPSTMWSCSLPKELQQSVAPSQPNQPNFRLEIQWDNSTTANATFLNVTGNSNLPSRIVRSKTAYAGQIMRRMMLQTRQSVTFEPSPPPPSFAEQYFLGNTTDGIVSDNKAGEPTPFYVSFLSTGAISTKLLKRDNFTGLIAGIAEAMQRFPPDIDADGTAAPANLLPIPTQQPLRLYDRGLSTEHYGFYTYFNRSIFLKSAINLESATFGDGPVPDDMNGGATKSEALSRCTWSETRFLVQMWTRKGSSASLLNATSLSTSTTTASENYTANEFAGPGSFPYPITITTDRHGGDPTRKALYCYGIDVREHLNSSLGRPYPGEQRGFGGAIINPASGLFTNTTSPSFNGVDGGTGGCSCQWMNWRSNL